MIYGVGYSSVNEDNYSDWRDKCYLTWRNMIKRCYSNEKKYENYRLHGTVVCDEWLDFSVFKKWFERNYYEIPGETMNLDKDILKRGNQVYCPEHCIFVPSIINHLFVKNDCIRGNLPIGVYYKNGKFISTCSVYGKNVKSKHNTVEGAFSAYKKIKENYIKEVAEHYKGLIPERLYNAMIMYEVKEDD